MEFKQGKSDKFWFAKVVKNELHTRFGRAGTKGRNSIKKFKSRKEAMEALRKKISEKKKKGYSKAKSFQKFKVVGISGREILFLKPKESTGLSQITPFTKGTRQVSFLGVPPMPAASR